MKSRERIRRVVRGQGKGEGVEGGREEKYGSREVRYLRVSRVREQRMKEVRLRVKRLRRVG